MTDTAAPSSTGVAEAVAAARSRIAAAAGRAGRDPADVRLVAVSKTFSAERAGEAIAAGVTDLGENKVQEALQKKEQLPPGVRWHLLGHLQTNKAGRAAAVFATVHSVDGERVARSLDARRPEEMPPLDVLLEVELTGIAGHTGYSPEQLEEAVRLVAALPRLRLRGLMTMAPPSGEPARARATFARLRELRDSLRERTEAPLEELSMGMSDDFEVAVEEGSTIVRLGRAIFGARPRRGEV